MADSYGQGDHGDPPVENADPDVGLEIPSPAHLAENLTHVFTDTEASNFERTMAAVGLNVFWLGCELARVTRFLEKVEFATESDMGVPKPRMH